MAALSSEAGESGLFTGRARFRGDGTAEPFGDPPPRISLRGETESRFLGGMPGQGRLGIPFKASQPMTLGLSGFGGASIRFQPVMARRKTLTPGDV